VRESEPGESADPDAAREVATATHPIGRRVPILWLLLPMLGGSAAASLAPPDAGTTVALAALAGLFGASAWIARNHAASNAAIAIGAVILAWAVQGDRLRPPTPSAPFPPREAILDLTITRTFGGPAPARPSGLAVVSATPPHLEQLRGGNVFWRLSAPAPEAPLAGSVWRMQGLLTALPAATESGPGGFHDWLARRHVQVQLNRAIPIGERRPATPASQRQRRVQQALESTLRRGAPPDRPWGAMVAATLLGRRDLLPPEHRDRFLLTGTFHLFAVSGLHVGTLATLVAMLGTITRLPRPCVAALVVAAAGAYAWATGMTPSGMRAFLLVAYLALATLLARQAAALPALAFTAAAVLAIDPAQWDSTGFRLSYTVVAGLLLLGRPWARAVQRNHAPTPDPAPPAPAGPVPSPLRRALPPLGLPQLVSRSLHTMRIAAAYSLAATVAGACLAVEAFGVVAPGAVVLNLLLIPPAGLLVCGGMLSVLAAALGLPGLSLHLNGACYLIVEGMTTLVTAAEVGDGWLFFEREVRHPLIGTGGTLLVIATLLALGPARLERHGWARLLPVLLVTLLLAVGTCTP